MAPFFRTMYYMVSDRNRRNVLRLEYLSCNIVSCSSFMTALPEPNAIPTTLDSCARYSPHPPRSATIEDCQKRGLIPWLRAFTHLEVWVGHIKYVSPFLFSPELCIVHGHDCHISPAIRPICMRCKCPRRRGHELINQEDRFW